MQNKTSVMIFMMPQRCERILLTAHLLKTYWHKSLFLKSMLLLASFLVPFFVHAQQAANNNTSVHPIHSQPKGKITWAINPGPPFHIVEGPLQGEGFCDGLVDSLIELLPHYDHQKVLVPQGRVLAMLAAPNSQMCFPCMIKRDVAPKGVLYSESTHQFPRHVLITRADFIEGQQPISLSQWLRTGHYRYGFPQGRRYGVLDPILEQYKQNFPKQVLERAGPGEADSILTLIEIGRVDFTVDYPMVLKYHRLVRPQTSQRLDTYTIAENQANPPIQAMGCANNLWGQQVIADINSVIVPLRTHPNFLRAKQFWESSTEVH